MATSVAAPVIWSELYHKFEHNPGGDLRLVTNVDAVKSSISNILGTRQGSRVMLPTFAEMYTDMLFEPIDSHLASFLSESVKTVIETWDDRVTVISSNFVSDPDHNSISLTINFLIPGYQNILELTHVF